MESDGVGHTALESEHEHGWADTSVQMHMNIYTIYHIHAQAQINTFIHIKMIFEVS